VRQPAHCCGIVGLKPSFGLVSKAGVLPLVWTMDHVGPLTRSVEDAALLLDCLAGHDPTDPYSAKREATGPFDPGVVSIAGRKIGVTRGFFFEGGDPEVVAVTEAALETWRGLGARLVDLDLPEVEEAFAAAGATFAEALAVHEKDVEARPEAFSEEVRAKLGQRGTSPLAYVKAQHVRRCFGAAVERAMAEADVEVLLAPTSNVTAAPIAAQPEDHGLYSWRNTGIFDFTGQPSISVPCGFTPAGLPVGLMVTGRLFEDATLLRFAQAFEQASPWHLKTPPGF
jgi:aspartyl-tRNA(Asn)/glutamyl-tRNA(Gln) amidotransferase subunit A